MPVQKIREIREWLNTPGFLASSTQPIVEVPVSVPNDPPPASTQPLRFRVFASSDEFVAWQDAGDAVGTGYDILGWKPVAGDFVSPGEQSVDDPRLDFGLFVVYRERQNAL